MALDLTDLTSKVDAIAAVIPNIQSDYVALFQAIEDLQGQLDPTVQATIDALAAKLGESVLALSNVDNQFPVPEPEPPTEPTE